MNAVDSGTFDVIVVGSGPGGATVARDLSRSGKKVLILEWGPGGPIRGNLAQYVRELMVPGKSLLITNRFLGLVRGITTGGSSVFYYGTCFPVPLEMFAAHGVDLTGDIEEVRRELPIGRLRDEMITPMAGRLMESARRLGFEIRPAGFRLRFNLLLNALDLWLTYSFTRGRLALPDILDVKQAVIRGDELVRRRGQISRLCAMLSRRP